MISKHTGRLQGLTGVLALMLAFAAAAAGKIKIHVPELPSAEATAPYPSQTFTAADGDDDATCCTWTSSGNLDGLTLSSAGVLSGTPTAAGSFPFTVTATDSKSASGTSGTLTLTVIAGPSISPASLPSGEQGVPYRPTLTATGGTPSDTWSLTGALPSGVSFSNGAFSGTPGPGTAGSYPITVQVTDSVGGSFSQGYTVMIVPPPSVTTASLPSGEVGVAYPSTALGATGGTAPYTWAITSGALPAGMTFSSGTLGGTPTAAASGSITFQVTDANGQTGSASLTLTVTAGLTITTPATLPNGEVTAPYPHSLAASGGTNTGFTWTVTSGSLPPGLSLSSGGAITGTPTTNGPFSFTAKVTDSGGGSATQAFTLNIAGGPSVSTPSPLPQGDVTAPYSQTLTASGGSGTGFVWAVTIGSLPAGLSLSAGGVISGTPTTPGGSSFTVQVTDSVNGRATQSFSLTIIAAPTITTSATLPQGEVGATYSQTLIATGGSNAGFTWSMTAGSLPAGLSLSTGGVLSGTPTAAALGVSGFTVQVTDSANGTATLVMSITIIAGPNITTAPALPNGSVGVTYTTVTLAASDGTLPYIWSITTGSLPLGLSLDPNAGTITGKPTTPTTGALSFTVQVIDAKGVTATKGFSITVASGLTITTAPGLPNGTIGITYSAAISAAGGTSPYTWSVTTGSLPTGLTLNPSTGAISGTPASSGIFSFTIQVTDSASVKATKPFTLTVAQVLTITTATILPSGAVGTPYSASLAATGGTPPYAFLVTSVGLPPGLSLSTAGLLTGTPASSGAFTFTVQVKDSNSVTVSQQFNLTVVSGLVITTAPQLPEGAVNSQYSQTLAAAGGTPPYTFTTAPGSPGPGLSLTPGGVITGTPKATGTLTFSVQVTDQVGATATKQFTLTIVAGLSITSPAVLPEGTIGVAYAALALAAVGGSQPCCTWSVSASSMAPGLSLSSNGIITGTPSAPGVFNFTVQAKDSSGATATRAFTISIVPPALPQVTIAVPPTSPAGQQIPVSLSLVSPYPLDITGQITLSFQPDAVAPAVDPALQFSTGGLTIGFTIPANTTKAVFPSSSQIALQTGTVSGTITLSFVLVAGGADLPSLESTITIPRAVPAIQSVKLVRTSAGLEIHVAAFSPSRDLTETDLTFTAAPGSTLQTTTLTENLASVATAWYKSTGSAQYGSQLMLVLPITASQGSVDAVGSVSVVLKNAQGSSPATSGTF